MCFILWEVYALYNVDFLRFENLNYEIFCLLSSSETRRLELERKLVEYKKSDAYL